MMNRIKLLFPVVLLALGAVGAVLMVATHLGEQVDWRGRTLAQQAFYAAQTHVQNRAEDLVAEAMEVAQMGELPDPGKDDSTLRWMLDGTGTIVAGYGAGFEDGKPDVHGMNVVSRALEGVASDAIVSLAGAEAGKDAWWHLAAAPIGNEGSVAGLVVIGKPLAQVMIGVLEQMADLTDRAKMPVTAALVSGRRVLAGKVHESIKGMLKPGKVDGSVQGVGNASLGMGLSGGSAAFVGGDLIPTESGRLVLGTVAQTRSVYRSLASKMKTSLGLIVVVFFIAVTLVLLQARRNDRAGETLITWLHTWRSSGAGAPVESLGLPGIFDRVARNVDLTMAGVFAGGGAARPETDVPSSFTGMEEETDFEQFSASNVFESGTTNTTSAGTVSLFEGLDDSAEPQDAGLPPLPTNLPAPPLPSALPSAPAPAAPGLAGKMIQSDSAIAPEDPGMFEDAPTGQFEVPDSLLEQIANESSPPEADEDPIHGLFAEYVALRERLGESNDGLTLERFQHKLDATRARIMEETGARDVRFSVREKNGTASLRALPITD